jgi:hypothetical protein
MCCFQYNDKVMQFRWSTLGSLIIVTAEVPVPYSAATWGVTHLSLMSFLVECLAFLLHQQDVPGLDMCPSGVSWQVACGFPQSFKTNVGILPRNIYVYLSTYLFIYTMCRKMIIWSWIVKNVEGSSCGLCQHFREWTEGNSEQSGYSEANEYTWHF